MFPAFTDEEQRTQREYLAQGYSRFHFWPITYSTAVNIHLHTYMLREHIFCWMYFRCEIAGLGDVHMAIFNTYCQMVFPRDTV